MSRKDHAKNEAERLSSTGFVSLEYMFLATLLSFDFHFQLYFNVLSASVSLRVPLKLFISTAIEFKRNCTLLWFEYKR